MQNESNVRRSNDNFAAATVAASIHGLINASSSSLRRRIENDHPVLRLNVTESLVNVSIPTSASNDSLPTTWNGSHSTARSLLPAATGRHVDAYYGLASVTFICICLGCAMSIAGMCKLKRRNTFGRTAAFFEEERFIPRHRRFTVTQIVCRSAAFLRDLDLDVEKRRQRMKATTMARSSTPPSLPESESFIHVPDILNPIPSRGGSPPAFRRKKVKKKKNNIRGRNNDNNLRDGGKGNANNNNHDDVVAKFAAAISSSSTASKSGLRLNRFRSKLRAAGCEWEKFHEKLSSKLSRLKSDPNYQRLSQSSHKERRGKQTGQQQRQKQQQQPQPQRRKPSSLDWKSGGYVPLMMSSEEDEDEEENEVFGGQSSEEDYYPLV